MNDRDRRTHDALDDELTTAQRKLSDSLADALRLYGSSHHVTRLIQHAQAQVADALRFNAEVRPGVPRTGNALRTDRKMIDYGPPD